MSQSTLQNQPNFLRPRNEFSSLAKSSACYESKGASFSLTESKLKSKCPKNQQGLKTAAVKAKKSIFKGETRNLVMSNDSRLQAVINGKGFATKSLK